MNIQSDQLRQGIEAARAGRIEEARQRLEQAVVDNPDELRAWAWLGEVCEGPAGRIEALERALALRGGGATPEVQARLDALKEELSALQASLQETARLLKSGAKQQAVGMLREITLKYPGNERAWFMQSYAEPVIEDQMAAIEKVLALNPGNQKAMQRRESLGRLIENPILLGLEYENGGDLNQAIATFYRVFMLSKSTDERTEASLYMEQARTRLEDPAWKPPSPTLTVLRLTGGPILLYGLLILMQGGLNPLHIAFHFYVEGVLVVVSSFILALTTSKPRHPRWLAEFGRPGELRETFIRLALILLGVFFMIGMYVLFFMEAWNRLVIYSATF
jgi:tetratricopeptide (TPR) repeat protein